MAESEYKYIKDLGEGSFGKVVLVKRDDKFLARKEMTDAPDLLVGVKEMNIVRMASFLSPYVVRLESHDLHLSSPSKYKIDHYLEYCNGGCLDEIITNEINSPTGEIFLGGISNRIRNVSNLLATLASLHANGIFHMDIKLDNILCRGEDLLLCDFSNSIVKNKWKENHSPPKSQYQSLIYRSPDIAALRTGWENAEKSDVWATGIMIMEIFGLAKKILKMETEADSLIENMKNIVARFKNRDTSKQIKENIFSNILPNDVSGWDIPKDSSNAYAYVWCNSFAGIVRRLNFESLLQESLDYFSSRGHAASDTERKNLRIIFTEVLPKMLRVHPQERATVREVCEILHIQVPNKNLPRAPERSPQTDVLWMETVTDLEESFKNLMVVYGPSKINIHDDILAYARALAETYLTNFTNIPHKTAEKQKFYDMVYAASVLIGCEVFDVMIVFDDEEFVIPNKISISDVGPYIIDICNRFPGEILLIPAKE